MTITISGKGWVVIPAELRKKYHLTPGSTMQVVDYDGVLALVPALPDPLRQSRGMLGGGQGERSLTEALLTERDLENRRGK